MPLDKIVIWTPGFSIKCGGIISLYNLAREIDQMNKDIDVYMYSNSREITQFNQS